MKIAEIILESDHDFDEHESMYDKARDRVEEWVSGYCTDSAIKEVYEFCDDNWFCMVHGDMYRQLVMKMRDVHDLRQLTAKLHLYDLERGRKYFSWSSKLDACLDFARGVDEDQLILSQTGDGIDVLSMVGYRLADMSDNAYEEEKEIIAPMYNNVHIVGLQCGGEYYPVDQFREFLKAVREL